MRPVYPLTSLLLASGLIGCERPDQNRTVETAPSEVAIPAVEQSAAPDTAPPSPAPSPACVVPTPDDAPVTASAAAHCPPGPTGPPALPHAYVTFLDLPAETRVEVEHALTTPHRTRGLMYRQELGEDDGMLFTWDDERPRSFWMRNTCLPLDMLFIAADGTIAGILEQVPTLNEAPRRIPCPARHVLELNAGWTRAHGVKAGQRVRIER